MDLYDLIADLIPFYGQGEANQGESYKTILFSYKMVIKIWKKGRIFAAKNQKP